MSKPDTVSQSPSSKMVRVEAMNTLHDLSFMQRVEMSPEMRQQAEECLRRLLRELTDKDKGSATMTTAPDPKTFCEHVLHDDEPCDCTFMLFTCRGCGLRSCNVHGQHPYCYGCRVLMSELEAKRMHAALLAELQRRREGRNPR